MTGFLTLLVAAFVGLAGGVSAQFGLNDDTDDVLPDSSFDFESDDFFSDAEKEMAAQCQGTRDGTGAIADISNDVTRERERRQDVDLDEEDVLLGIALHNNGADDVSFNELRSVSLEEERTIEQDQDSSLEEEDVFSALALGITAKGGTLDVLSCVSDLSRNVEERREFDQDVDLDEDTVLLAIALANAADSELRLADVRDIDRDERIERDYDQDIDIDQDDTFLALALGAG